MMDNKALDHQPVRIINRVATTLTVLLLIYCAVYSWQSWSSEKSEQVKNLMNIMELGEKAVDTYFTQLESSMRGLSEDLTGADGEIDLEHAFSLVRRFKDLHPELANVTLMRGDGQILLTATIPPGPNLPTLALEPSFVKFREELEQGRPVSIGRPLVGLITKQWIIPLRYGIKNKEGKLTRIISANLPIGILQNFWKGAPFTRTAALGLIRDDGFLVSRYPVSSRFQMDEIYGKPRTGALIGYLKEEQFPVKGYIEGRSSLDGPNHLNAFRRLEHFPITLFIAMPISEIRAGWWEKVKVPYLLSALLLMGGIVVSRITIRRQRAREVEQWQAHGALRESEERFRLITETIQDVFWMATPGIEKMLYVSPAYERIWGRTRESLYAEPRSFIEAVHPEDRALVLLQLEDHAKGSWKCQYRIIQPDGRVRWIDDRGFPVRDENGALRFVTGVATDITDRKKAEDELRDQAALLELAHDAILVRGMDGRIRYWSSGAEKTYGWSKEEALGRSSHELLKTAFAEPLQEIQKECLASGQWEGELTHTAREGKSVTVASRWAVQKDVSGKPVAFLEINRDVTERKRAEEQVKFTMQKLQGSNQALQDFATIASHDLQEPLRKVSSFGKMLKQKYGDTLGEGGKDYLDRMLGATKRMESLLKALLDYSRVSTRAEPYKEVDLSMLVGEVLSDLEWRIEKTGGVVQVGDLPTIEADPTQMRQLFQNLIGNGLKFHKEGEKPVVKVKCSADGPDSYEVTVQDNGIGFEVQYLEKIFAPFQRLHGRSSRYEGTGMGLAICRKIVERHGGSITAESAPGQGATFLVTLPVKQNSDRSP